MTADIAVRDEDVDPPDCIISTREWREPLFHVRGVDYERVNTRPSITIWVPIQSFTQSSDDV